VIARSVLARSVIAIDGLDGSGKSQLAAGLTQALAAAGQTAVILHVDDFRRPVAFEAESQADSQVDSQVDSEVESNVRESTRYYDSYYDFAALDVTLRAFLNGGHDGAVAILEGVFVLRASLPAETPLIVLEVSPDEAQRRILARDRAKGRTVDEIVRRIERRYFPAQAHYRALFDPLARADVLVDNTDWTRPRVLRRSDRRFPPRIVPQLDRFLPVG
jgi:uridine kinase